MSGGGDNGQPQRGAVSAPVMGGGQRNQAPAPQAKIAQPAEGTTYEAAGTWTFTLDSPQGGGGTIVIKNDNNTYSGTIKTERMKEETAFTSVVVNGNELTLTYTVNFGGNTVPVTVKSTFNNADMQGTMSFGEFRTMNFTGKKSN